MASLPEPRRGAEGERHKTWLYYHVTFIVRVSFFPAIHLFPIKMWARVSGAVLYYHIKRSIIAEEEEEGGRQEDGCPGPTSPSSSCPTPVQGNDKAVPFAAAEQSQF